jgi:hypothetical protein
MKVEDSNNVFMSESLQGNLPDIDILDLQDKFILSILSIIVGESIESVIGNVVSYSIDQEEIKLGVRVMIPDAFGLLEAWPSVRLQKYDLCLGENTIEFFGPFSATSLGVQDIDSTRQLCVLAMKLRRE